MFGQFTAREKIFISDIHPSNRIEKRRYVFDQTSLSLSALQIDYFNWYTSIISTEGVKLSQSKCTHCRGSHPTEKRFNQQRKVNVSKSFSSYFNSRKNKDD